MKKQFPIISFEHVSFQYEGQTRENLKDINLTIKSGELPGKADVERPL